MRIVFYNHTGLVSGAEKMLLLSLAKLPRDAYETSLVCPSEGKLRASAEALGVPCYEVRPIQARFTYNPVQLVRYVASIGRTLLGLRRRFLSLAPDVIQANTVRAGIVATLATLGTRVPVVWHIHDILPSHPVTKCIRRLAHSTKRNHLVACSEAAADSLRTSRKDTGNRGVTAILNGIEIEQYRKNDGTRRLMREQLGFNASTIVIGIVGQITKRKGHLGLIQAFAQMRNTVPGAVLAIAGAPLFNKDQEYLELLQQEVERLHLEGSVRFLGQRCDIPDVMQAMDMVVVNSDVEPFALVLIEAMAMQKAVIATASGGPSELVESGVSGEIVPVGDLSALTNSMIALARQPQLRQDYGLRGSRFVEGGFSTEVYMDKWRTLYDSIAGPGESTLKLEREPSSAAQEVRG